MITAEDLREPRLVPWRVHSAPKERGYEGLASHLNHIWKQQFGNAHKM